MNRYIACHSHAQSPNGPRRSTPSFERLTALGLSEEEIRRIVENELAVVRKKSDTEVT